MFSKANVGRCISIISRFRLELMLTLCLMGTAVALLIPKSNAAPAPAFGPTLLHFNGNAPEDSGCTGIGAVDATGPSSNNCATLTETASLSSGPAAKWVAVAGTNQATDRNQVDPNWLWNLTGPTTLSGPMTINWWQACNAECVALGGTWRVRLWADGVQVFTQENISATPATPNVPSLLTTTVNLPKVTANTKFVIHIDTQFSDTGQGATIFYDSSLPCPGNTTGPCDSTVTMPVVDPNASPTPTPEATATPTPMPPGPGTPRFQVYVPTSSFSGGEPSIGADWKTGNAMYLASFNPIRIAFDDSTSPARDTWTNTSIPSAVSLDPILFTDHLLPTGMPNRTFVSQLTGQDSITFYTDDDGANYSPSQGGGIPSGVDHQTIGAGPYKPNTTPSASPRTAYPNAVYYCSQEAATAFCARSDDGGQTFGPGIPIYELLQCTGIHGHVKVAPDGTVYVPNRSCGSKAAVVVSNDNGVTWAVRPNPSSSNTGFLVDPSVGIGVNNVGKPTGQASNTIYLGYQASDGHPRIAVSHDQGNSWVNDQDVGTLFGIQNSTFPEVVAGDDNRAAYAFLGTTVIGDYTNQATYNQSAPWHLYIATTFDGGVTWTTTDATPNDPVQRGSICNLGTTSCNGHSPNDRNLLDFMDATVDAQGRTLVGYPDGCIGSCVKKPSGLHPNSYTSRASIARQSGGRRLLAAFDPTEPGLPAAPKAKADISTAGGPTIVSWPAADDAGATITSYKVYRRDGANGSFNLIATVSGISFSDTTFTAPATSNAYRVTAVNAFGEGPYAGDVVPVVVTFESSCVYPYITVGGEGIPGAVPADPTGGELTIQRLNVGEPFTTCDDNSLSLIMKVNTLDPQNAGTAVLPPNSEWQILFGLTDTDGNAQRAYVAVDTFSPNTPATPRISIGRRDPTATGTLDSRVCTNDLTNTCPAVSANFNKDGTIVIKLNLAAPLAFGAPGTGATGTAFTWDGRAAGTTIGAAQVITGTTYVLAGAGAGLLESVQTTSGEEYTRIGNTACATGVPNASLAANPTSGAVPLTVNFDASVSSVPQSCNTIASYALDFGDGSTGTQSSPTFSHTYNNAADYTARLSVTDSAGRTSTNDAHVVIHVTSGTPTPTPTPTPNPSPTPTPGQPPPAATFGHNTLTDFSAVGGEPFIRVDKQDNVFVSSPFGLSTSVSLLWKSIDHGRSFIPLGTPIVRDSVLGPGGGDTHQAFDAQNRLYYSDLSGGCVTVAVSEDGGNTFPLDHSNVLTCIGTGEDPEGAQDDRQWVAGFGDGIGYMTVRNLLVAVGSGNFHLSKTIDAGKTWHAQILGNVGQSGNLEVDKVKRRVTVNGVEKDAILLYQLYYSGGTLKMFRITDFNDGTPLIVNDLTIGTPGGTVANVFPVMTIDKAGNLYVVWSKNAQAIFMATSTDRGNTWSAPAQVSPASMTGTNIMPWIVAGDPGRVDVVWYRTPGGNNAQSVWDIYMAQSIDALSGAPGFSTNKVNENTIHTGEICLNGLNCDISTVQGSPRDRSFLEFPSIDIDSTGAAYITYNDSTNQIVAPYVMVARQTGGPSLIASVGSLPGSSGAVTISQPAANANITTPSMTLSGTQTLTPKNFDRDDNADAKFPDHGAVIGSNVPALDLKSVSLSDDANSLTVTMQVADLTTASLAAAPALSGGDGVLYLTQMHSGNSVFWIAAEVRGGVPRFLTGNLGSINSALSKKYITYNPDASNSLSVQGSVSNTAPGTITMKIPRSLIGSPANGTTLTSVTGYAFSERGPLAPIPGGNGNANVTSLPIQVDAAGALSYTLGDGAPLFNGVVEISIDDPNFTAPRLAALGDVVNANTWSLQLSGSDLVSGAHTAYVRQRIKGSDPSPVISVVYTVSATIEQSVSSMVSLVTANPRSSLGVSSYDVSMKNISSMSILAPMRLEVASITSASGTVTVANADNSKTGAGAIWDYSTKLGADNALTANETSAARNLRFNNPRNDAFTVTFNIIGNLDRAAAGGSSSSSPSGSGTSPSSSSSTTTSTVTNLVFQITYNPLLNSLTSQLIKR